ncbi:MAG: 2'-5' RNA ligase family protein [Saprospiraceae bacterium]|nr:2'-5' RNA ligase family protein [Saprospiraceae bacterium]MDW8228793.1 2'-5' RNA ligase family protein [Saprospiraceae bacterium]
MEEQLLLFIAIMPSRAVQEEVTAMKQYIADKWGPRHALKSPAHITLQPPFQWSEEAMPELKERLRHFASAQKPFWVVLNDYGAFAPKVFFIKPELSPQIKTLFARLRKTLETELHFVYDKKNERPFHPHMTLAHRDMPPTVFDQIWADFQERPYYRTFAVNSLALLRWMGDCWEVHEEFPFARK